jgi:hypothetical protein
MSLSFELQYALSTTSSSSPIDFASWLILTSFWNSFVVGILSKSHEFVLNVLQPCPRLFLSVVDYDLRLQFFFCERRSFFKADFLR